jgi:hypothetical protein
MEEIKQLEEENSVMLQQFKTLQSEIQKKKQRIQEIKINMVPPELVEEFEEVTKQEKEAYINHLRLVCKKDDLRKKIEKYYTT